MKKHTTGGVKGAKAYSKQQAKRRGANHARRVVLGLVRMGGNDPRYMPPPSGMNRAERRRAGMMPR